MHELTELIVRRANKNYLFWSDITQKRGCLVMEQVVINNALNVSNILHVTKGKQNFRHLPMWQKNILT